jgi:protein disulfide-isomerase
MRWLASFALVVLTALTGIGQAAELPYDEHANAPEQVRQAVAAAHAAGKDVLLVFGANWCPDCRVLDSVLHQNAAISDRFVIVKINVGDFNQNLDLVKRYEVPLGKGIPAAAVVSDQDELLYVTQGGELANAHHMGESAIVDLFSRIVADARVAGRSASSRSP